MAYRLQSTETIKEAVQRIGLEQLDKGLSEIDDPGLDLHKKVHQVRKRMKKLRGLLRLVRLAMPDIYARENAHFRDAARTVSDVRDASAYLETYDALMDRYAEAVDRPAFAPIRAALTRRRARLTKAQDVASRVTHIREELLAAKDRVSGWTLQAEAFDALRGGLKKTYKRACRAMDDAYDAHTAERFHEWRKRAKYHRYHMRILVPLWKPVIDKRQQLLHQLTDYLGDMHDLAELLRVMKDESEVFGKLKHLQVFQALMERRREALRAAARPQGIRLFAEAPAALVRRMEACWRARACTRLRATHTFAPVPSV